MNIILIQTSKNKQEAAFTANYLKANNITTDGEKNMLTLSLHYPKSHTDIYKEEEIKKINL